MWDNRVMNQGQIKRLFEAWEPYASRTLIIIDFANVEKWKDSTGWRIGIRELQQLVRNFSIGDKNLRRFYYGSDYGPKDSCTILMPWSDNLIKKAKYSNFQVISKRVKYIRDKVSGDDIRKCDLDVEMAIDMIKLVTEYDRVVLFSGDGDLACALEYVRDTYNKEVYVFGARDHVGRELIDAKNSGNIKTLFFAEDFEYRLSMDRNNRS